MTRAALALLLLVGCGDDGDDDDDGPGVGPDAPTGDDDDDDDGPTVMGVYESGDRLKMRVGDSPDGARHFIGWFDEELGIACAFATATDGAQRCLPAVAMNVASFFADDGCTQPLGFHNPCSTSPEYMRRVDVCTGEQDIYRVGPAFTGQAYQGSPGSCFAVTPNAVELYTLGAEQAASTFVAIEESVE